MQPVRELDDEDSHILAHGDYHLAHGFRLRAVSKLNLVQFRDSIDQ